MGVRYVVPWGKWHTNHRKDYPDAIEDESEGGKGYAKTFMEWCGKVTKKLQ